jgi:hypothetical protein
MTREKRSDFLVSANFTIKIPRQSILICHYRYTQFTVIADQYFFTDPAIFSNKQGAYTNSLGTETEPSGYLQGPPILLRCGSEVRQTQWTAQEHSCGSSA